MSTAYQVFARKYRPKTFDDVLGQDHVVQTLRNAIEQDRLAHAYLFVGPRGTGKTSTARILAKALNCPDGPKVDFDPDDPLCVEIAQGNSLDVLEIDGASNNGVEQVRELRDTVKFAPSSGQFKIYYIDEVHMLTTAAFNALLKTLEEPPDHVKFIFATTEPQKILPTIISRCQRFDLRRIPTDIIANHLLYIAKEEGIAIEEAAAFAIAKGAEGGMRDAQSMLDQLVAFCGDSIKEANVLEIFGFNSAESISALAGYILKQDNSAALAAVHQHHEAGKDLSKLLSDIISHYRNVMVKMVDPKADTGEIPTEIRDEIVAQSQLVTTARLLSLIDLLAETDARMKWAPNKRLHLEVGVIKAIQTIGEASLDDVIALVSGAATAAESLPAPSAASAPARAAAPAPAAEERVKLVLPEPEPEVPVTPSPPAAEPEPVASSESVAEPVATPEPEPAPEPAPAPPAGDLKGAALWDAARDALIDARPLFQTWLTSAHFLSHSDGEFVVGFPTDQRFYRESLVRYESDIKDQLDALSGEFLTLKMEVRDDLATLEVDIGIGEEDEPEPEAEVIVEVAPEPVAEAPLEPEVPQDDFKDDPLIKEALKTFEAKVIKS